MIVHLFDDEPDVVEPEAAPRLLDVYQDFERLLSRQLEQARMRIEELEALIERALDDLEPDDGEQGELTEVRQPARYHA